jgi:hypothetical protein
MFVPESYIGRNVTPRVIRAVVEDTINRHEEDYAGEILVDLRLVLDIPDGLILVGGSYGDDTIVVSLAAKNPYDTINFTEEMWEWFNHEIAKTIVHEGIHMEQDREGRFGKIVTEVDKDLTHKQYLGSDIEMEAYGRADIPMDIRKYGSSVQLDEYEEIFGADSEEVKIIKDYAGVIG